MKATELPYGKFQTCVFNLAKELGDDGAVPMSNLGEHNFCKRVAKYMHAGAPERITVTVSTRKKAFLKAIEELERQKNLNPQQVAELIAQKRRPLNRKYAFDDYWNATRIHCHFTNETGLEIADALGTTLEYLQRISRDPSYAMSLELDPDFVILDILKKIPADVKTASEFFHWFSGEVDRQNPVPDIK
jgi:hypothetical protein